MVAQKPEDTAKAEANFAEFLRNYDSRHRSYVLEATQFDNYYNGKQWTESELAALGDRPALTINIAKKTINAIYGHYAASRVDFVYKAKKDATEDQAQTITRLTDHILDQSRYHEAEAQMVLNGLVRDRGFLDIRMDFDTNLLGDVCVRHLDSRDVILDPEAKEYNPRTWSRVTEIEWTSLNQIELLYGKDKMQQVEFAAMNGQGLGSESVRFGSESETAGATDGWMHPAGEDRKRIRAVRVIKSQYRKLGKVREFVDPMTLDTSEIPEDWTEERIKAISEQYELMTREVLRERIRWTITADRVLLFDGWSKYKNFTIIPFFPYFLTGMPTGVMRDLISPQDQLNKVESQTLHVVNTTANSGWMVEAGSLANMTPEDLEQDGAKTGLVVVYNRNKEMPTKIQPNQIPTGLERLSQKAAGYIIDIPGAATLVGEQPSPEVSGVVLESTTARALMGLAPIMDNLKLTRRLVGEFILDCIQTFYTEPRILRVTDWRNPQEPEYDLAVNTDVLNNVTLGKYDVVVGTAPARDTAEEAEFAQALQMREAGVLIPDYHVILSSNLHNKRVIAEEARRLQGLAEPTPEEQQFAQMTQELQLQMLQAEIGKLAAAIEDLNATAALKHAQAGAAEVDAQLSVQEQNFRQQYDAQKMRADIAKQIANLMNKLELAGIHSEAKKELTRYTTMMKSFDHKDQINAQLQAEKFRAQARAKPRKSR